MRARRPRPLPCALHRRSPETQARTRRPGDGDRRLAHRPSEVPTCPTWASGPTRSSGPCPGSGASKRPRAYGRLASTSSTSAGRTRPWPRRVASASPLSGPMDSGRRDGAAQPGVERGDCVSRCLCTLDTLEEEIGEALETPLGRGASERARSSPPRRPLVAVPQNELDALLASAVGSTRPEKHPQDAHPGPEADSACRRPSSTNSSPRRTS